MSWIEIYAFFISPLILLGLGVAAAAFLDGPITWRRQASPIEIKTQKGEH